MNSCIPRRFRALLVTVLTYLSALHHTRTERGASAVEYALLIVGVAMASYAMLRGLGMALNVIFEHAVGNVSVEP